MPTGMRASSCQAPSATSYFTEEHLIGIFASFPHVTDRNRVEASRPTHPKKHPATHFVPRKPVTLIFDQHSLDSFRTSGVFPGLHSSLHLTGRPVAEVSPNPLTSTRASPALPFPSRRSRMTEGNREARIEEGFAPFRPTPLSPVSHAFRLRRNGSEWLSSPEIDCSSGSGPLSTQAERDRE